MRWAMLTALACSASSALAAAWYWYKSSRVPIPNQNPDANSIDIYDLRRIQSEIWGITVTLNLSGKLNSRAAQWSAIAAIAGAVAVILSLGISN